MNSDFWIDIALSILLGVLRRKQDLGQWSKAFRKLYDVIGAAYGWSIVDDNLQLKLTETNVLP